MLKLPIIKSLTLLLKGSMDVISLSSYGIPLHSAAAECRKELFPYVASLNL